MRFESISSLVLVVVNAILLGGCQRNADEEAAVLPSQTVVSPAENEVLLAMARGLPTRLLPSDFGEPGYVPPQMRCAPALRDPDVPEAELRLMQEFLRHDQWQKEDTTRHERYAEGHYRTIPQQLYGLQSEQLLRVNCARQAATGILAPIE
ncbi:MAG: hypothetical protein H0U67_12575 [Gemmatimonadetes bacterium]|nr:hypothetical protein [Gemmatimonadota bacterium]